MLKFDRIAQKNETRLNLTVTLEYSDRVKTLIAVAKTFCHSLFQASILCRTACYFQIKRAC